MKKLSILAALMLSTCAPAYAQDNVTMATESAFDACHRHLNPIDPPDDPDGFYAANCPTVKALYTKVTSDEMSARERAVIAAQQQQAVHDRQSVLDAMRIARARDIRSTDIGDQ